MSAARPLRFAALSLVLLGLAACAARPVSDAPPVEPLPATGARAAPEQAAAAAPETAARVPDVAPAELVGLDARGLDRLLGQPELVRRDGGAEMRLYRSTACTLHLFLYPRDGAPRATYLEARNRAGRLDAAEEARCLHSLTRAARPG